MDYSYWEITVVVANHQDRKQEGIFESASYQGCWDGYTLTPVFSSYQEQILILWFFYSWWLFRQFYRWIRSLDPFESVELQRIYSFSIHSPGFLRIYLYVLFCSSVLILMLICPGLWCYQHSWSLLLTCQGSILKTCWLIATRCSQNYWYFFSFITYFIYSW